MNRTPGSGGSRGEGARDVLRGSLSCWWWRTPLNHDEASVGRHLISEWLFISPCSGTRPAQEMEQLGGAPASRLVISPAVTYPQNHYEASARLRPAIDSLLTRSPRVSPRWEDDFTVVDSPRERGKFTKNRVLRFSQI